MLRMVLLLFLVTALASGYSSVVATYDPATGRSEKRKMGSEWDEFVVSVNSDIRLEIRGEQPLAGFKSWKEYWEWRMRGASEKQVNFIKSRRRELGLSNSE
jgi:hypothetical protein